MVKLLCVCCATTLFITWKKGHFLGNDFGITLQRNAPLPHVSGFYYLLPVLLFSPSIINMFQICLQAVSRPSLNYFLGSLTYSVRVSSALAGYWQILKNMWCYDRQIDKMRAPLPPHACLWQVLSPLVGFLVSVPHRLVLWWSLYLQVPQLSFFFKALSGPSHLIYYKLLCEISFSLSRVS